MCIVVKVAEIDIPSQKIFFVDLTTGKWEISSLIHIFQAHLPLIFLLNEFCRFIKSSFNINKSYSDNNIRKEHVILYS